MASHGFIALSLASFLYNVSSSSGTGAQCCTNSWTFFPADQRCYKYLSGDVEYATSFHNCENSHNATLPIVKSNFTQTFLASLAGNDSSFWIGLSAYNDFEELRWIDGTSYNSSVLSASPDFNHQICQVQLQVDSTGTISWQGENCVGNDNPATASTICVRDPHCSSTTASTTAFPTTTTAAPTSTSKKSATSATTSTATTTTAKATATTVRHHTTVSIETTSQPATALTVASTTQQTSTEEHQRTTRQQPSPTSTANMPISTATADWTIASTDRTPSTSASITATQLSTIATAQQGRDETTSATTTQDIEGTSTSTFSVTDTSASEQMTYVATNTTSNVPITSSTALTTNKAQTSTADPGTEQEQYTTNFSTLLISHNYSSLTTTSATKTEYVRSTVGNTSSTITKILNITTLKSDATETTPQQVTLPVTGKSVAGNVSPVGAIVGSILALIMVLAIAGLLIYMLLKRKRKTSDKEDGEIVAENL